MVAASEISVDGSSDASSASLKSAQAFRTISEVADDLDIPQHVLRFWETRFSQIKPLKRGGGRRYYRPDDVELLKSIRHLLYGQGYTIKGVQRILKEEGVKAVQKIARHSIDQTHSDQTPKDNIQLDAIDNISNTDSEYNDHASKQPNHAVGKAQKTLGTQLSRANAVTNASINNVPYIEVSEADRRLLLSAYQELAECRSLLASLFSDAKYVMEHTHLNVA